MRASLPTDLDGHEISASVRPSELDFVGAPALGVDGGAPTGLARARAFGRRNELSTRMVSARRAIVSVEHDVRRLPSRKREPLALPLGLHVVLTGIAARPASVMR